MPHESFIVPSQLPSGTLHFAPVKSDATARDVVAVSGPTANFGPTFSGTSTTTSGSSSAYAWRSAATRASLLPAPCSLLVTVGYDA